MFANQIEIVAAFRQPWGALGDTAGAA